LVAVKHQTIPGLAERPINEHDPYRESGAADRANTALTRQASVARSPSPFPYQLNVFALT